MKLKVPFIQLPILFDAAALAEEIEGIEDSAWRGRTQRDDGNTALTLITAGGDPDNDELSGVMQPTPWLQRCPYLMQSLDALGATWGRARLMRLSGQAEVKPHVDINYYWRERMRVHIPILTTPSVRFQCGEGEINMAQGECWVFDTWRRHRVLNEGNQTRIHLVADTIGGDRFWDLLNAGRPPGRRGPEWNPGRVEAGLQSRPELDFETVNAPVVMTPWELREHIVFLLDEAVPHPSLAQVQPALLAFARRWHALWACYGERREGWSRYRELLQATRAELIARGIGQVGLRNEVGLMQALDAYVFDMALADGDTRSAEAKLDLHGAGPHVGAVNVPAARASHSGGEAPDFDRPVFIVSPPRSGSSLLFETLAGAPDVHTIGDESHQLIEGVQGLAPSQRGYDSNRLLAGDASPQAATALRERFHSALRDRQAQLPNGSERVRMLEKTPKNALRIPFLSAVFPDARFVYLHRDPRQVLGSMIDGWRSGRFVTYADLPGWQGDPWSFLLIPQWRELSGRPLEEVVARQWETTTRILLDDFQALPTERRIAIDYGRFLANPQAEIERLCAWAGYRWDRRLGTQLPYSRYTTTAPDPEKWRRHAAAIVPRLSQMQATVDRAAEVARY